MEETISLAKIALGYLYYDENDRVMRRDGAPAWVISMIRHAHGDMLPDDHKYQFIMDSLHRIVDGNTHIEPDIFNTERLRWLSSNLRRFSYCDDFLDEFGPWESSIMDLIGAGQLREMIEVDYLVRDFIEGMAND